MCSDTYVLLFLLHYFQMIRSTAISKTTEREYILLKIHENLTPDFYKAPFGFYALICLMLSNKEISWLFKKVVLGYLCDSTKRSIASVNQSFKVTYVSQNSWIHRNYHQPVKHFKKKFFEYITLPFSGNHLSSFAIVAGSRRLLLEMV